MAKTADGRPAGVVAAYEKLVATNPNVKRKGATMPYTSVNGNMFSVLTKEGKLALRLPAEQRKAFLKKHKTKLCEQYGVVMKEYVEVPDALLRKTAELRPYFDLSYAYTSALKPKATTRKKVAKRM
jgi:TfoX/Sxy family transcriptional regulator of competence genes